MKNKASVLAMLLLLLVAPAMQVLAGDEDDGESRAYGWGMMGPGMMGRGMMGAGPMGFGMMGGHDFVLAHLEMLRQALDLSDQQVSQARDLWLQHIRATAPLEVDLRIARAELQILLQNLLGPGSLDMARVEQAVRRIGELQSNLQVAHLRSLAQAVDLLTDEQTEQLRSLMRGGRRGFPGRAGEDGQPRQRQPQPRTPGRMMNPGQPR